MLKLNFQLKFFSDSKAAIAISCNPVFHDRTKHFKIDLHFLREKISKGVIKPVKIQSNDQVADIFTKGVGIVQHKVFFVKSLG